MSERAVVFGGSGYVGSHVADALTDAGFEVRVFDLRPSPHLRDGQEMVVGDILDESAVSEAVAGCDIVYNLAGIADIEEAARRPVDTVRYNVLGNTVVLEAARQCGVQRFVFASSVYVYSDSGSFYRSSKQASERLIEDYARIYGLPFTVLRYGSLYGGRAGKQNGIYKLLHQAMAGGKIVYWGNGEEMREYIHIEDAARGSVAVLEPEFENQYVVLTGHQRIRAQDLLDMINEMLGGEVRFEYMDQPPDLHYRMTPYSFNPRIGKKLVNDYYVDMGQGLLNCMAEIYADIHRDLRQTDDLLIREALSGNGNGNGKGPGRCHSIPKAGLASSR